MSEKIIKNIVKRELSSENWGQKLILAEEDNFFINEYTINSKEKIEICLQNQNVYFILVSGCAEFDFDNSKKLFFKGDKVIFDIKNRSKDIVITNRGVIPLIFIKIELKNKF